jgi:hypothetical protein
MFMQTPVQLLGLLATIVICGWAIWRGSSPVRHAAAAIVAAFIATPLVQNWHNWTDPQWGIFWVDFALFAYLLVLDLRHRAWWCRVAVACQLLTVLSHISMALNPAILARAYASTTYLLYFGLLGAVAWGLRPTRATPEVV